MYILHIQGQLHGQMPTKVSYELHRSTIPEEEGPEGSGDQPQPIREARDISGDQTLPIRSKEPEAGTQFPSRSSSISYYQPADSTMVPGSSAPSQPGTTGKQTGPSPIPSGPSPIPSGTPAIPELPETPNQGIQVSYITKTLPDGRTVQTRIVRGPVQRKARIIKINRELPNGEHELISTLQVPGDQEVDIDQTVKSILSGGGVPAGQQPAHPAGPPAGPAVPLEHYDNIPQHEQNHIKPGVPSPIQTHIGDIIDETKPPVSGRRTSLRDKFRWRPRSRSSSTSSVPPQSPGSIASSTGVPYERQNSTGPVIGFERHITTLGEDDGSITYR